MVQNIIYTNIVDELKTNIFLESIPARTSVQTNAMIPKQQKWKNVYMTMIVKQQ